VANAIAGNRDDRDWSHPRASLADAARKLLQLDARDVEHRPDQVIRAAAPSRRWPLVPAPRARRKITVLRLVVAGMSDGDAIGRESTRIASRKIRCRAEAAGHLDRNVVFLRLGRDIGVADDRRDAKSIRQRAAECRIRVGVNAH
jgi:hypothetical protein